MTNLGTKIRGLRKRKGLSQEDLAETAKVNLRTIQRIENNENEPRGKTLQLICEALDINVDDILDYGKKEDKNYLILLHLSVISFLIIPLGNIIIPLVIWLIKKDKIIGIKEVGSRLLNFQIFWTFITYGFLITCIVLAMLRTKIGLGSFSSLLLIYLGFNIINVILPIIYAIRTSSNHNSLYPNILKLIK